MWQINLIPEELQQKHRSNLIVQTLLLTLLLTGVLIVLIHFTLSFSIKRLEGRSQEPSQVSTDATLSQLKKEYEQLKAEKSGLYKSKGPLIELIALRFPLADMLKVLANNSAEKVWFDEMILNTKLDVCNLNGKSFNTRLVSEFMLEMKKMPYFKEIQLTYMEKNKQSSSLFDFKIECQFK